MFGGTYPATATRICDAYAIQNETPRGLQVLKERFAQAPRCDVYDRLKAGIFNIQRVCAWG